MRIRQTCMAIIVGSLLLSPCLSLAEQPKSGTSNGSMKSQSKQQQGSGNKGMESYKPSSGAQEGSDSTLPDPTTMPYPDKSAKKGKGSSSSSGSGTGSGSMGSSGSGSSGGTGSSGGSGGGY
ncbi:MAG: hypothetical protein MRJ68_17825 [Nitrospira sp.]|nr:hypothetical protein [Nitrospira sp.]